MNTCKRCGKEFDPNKSEFKGYRLNPKSPARMCDDCMCRNLYDMAGLPTPPELIDEYSTQPTLTREEYKRKLAL